jgi:2,4-dichlorophenol 6-monooxygenase
MRVSLLARSGTKSLTIARHPTAALEPRATITNQRTAEILRDIGLEERWGVIGMPLPTVGHSVVATSFADRELFRYCCYGTGDRMSDYFMASSCVGCNAPQHPIERELLPAIRQQGTDVLFSNELVEIEQPEGAVLADKWVFSENQRIRRSSKRKTSITAWRRPSGCTPATRRSPLRRAHQGHGDLG